MLKYRDVTNGFNKIQEAPLGYLIQTSKKKMQSVDWRFKDDGRGH